MSPEDRRDLLAKADWFRQYAKDERAAGAEQQAARYDERARLCEQVARACLEVKHGVTTRDDLLAAGLTPAGADELLRFGARLAAMPSRKHPM